MFPAALSALEVASHSPWISRFLQSLGHVVLVANARRVRAIYANVRKCELLEVMMLARIARMDPNMLHPVEHGGEQAQRELLLIKLRDSLVSQRVNFISSVCFTSAPGP